MKILSRSIAFFSQERKKIFFVLLGGVFFFVVFVLYSLWSVHRFLDEIKSESSVEIVDRNGSILYTVITERGYEKYSSLSEIPDLIQSGFILSEDQRYYDHLGMDLGRIFRCSIGIAFSNESCGASTITQQYVKLVKGNQFKRTIPNKLDEITTAFGLSLITSKDDILEKYLNEIYFGNLRYGIASASYGYFGKDLDELSIAESALLVSIPNSPERYNPYTHFDVVNERKNLIIDLWYEEGYITKAERDASKDSRPLVGDFDGGIQAPHFVMMALEGTPKDGQITTTIDLDIYEKIEPIISEAMKGFELKNATNASVVVLDRETGEILSLHGSEDYFSRHIQGKYNVALSLQDPGSTLKPFVYGYAFEEGRVPDNRILDAVQVFDLPMGEVYIPQNYDLQEHGIVTIREALSNSYNIPAVETLLSLGDVGGFLERLDRAGIKGLNHENTGVAIALGGGSVEFLDLVNAYRVFVNNGENLGDPSIFFENNTAQSVKVFGEESNEVAWMIADILSDTDARRPSFGSLTALDLPFWAGVKTGTSRDFRDSLAIGFSSEFVVGVWVGNNDNAHMDGLSGAQGAGQIWHDVMLVTAEYYQEKGKSLFQPKRPDTLNKEIVSNPEYDILDKFDPDAVAIIDPVEGDVFVAPEGTNIIVEYFSNRNYDSYELWMDGVLIDTKKTSFDDLSFPLVHGSHTIWIIARGDDIIPMESNHVTISLEGE